MSEMEDRNKRLVDALAGRWMSMSAIAAPQESDIRSLLSENERLREALEDALGFVAAWAGYYAVAYEGKPAGGPINERHQATLDKIAAALSGEVRQ